MYYLSSRPCSKLLALGHYLELSSNVPCMIQHNRHGSIVLINCFTDRKASQTSVG